MSRSVLRELEDLRILLRSPRPSLPASQLGPGPQEASSSLPKQYADVLQTAEVSLFYFTAFWPFARGLLACCR